LFIKECMKLKEPFFYNEVCHRYVAVLMEIPEKTRNKMLKDFSFFQKWTIEHPARWRLLKTAPSHLQSSIFSDFCAQNGFISETQNFFQLLCHYGHVPLSLLMIQYFKDRIINLSSQKIYFFSSCDLSISQKEELEQFLEKIFSRKVNLSYRVDPSLLLGGVLIWNQIMIDASLSALFHHLKQETCYGTQPS
jgi:F0F1-type ATP synthase delta subunit